MQPQKYAILGLNEVYFGIFHFWEQSFTGECSTKHAQYLLCDGDYVAGIIQKHVEIEDVARHRLRWWGLDFKSDCWWSMSSICSYNATSSQSTSKGK